jgi:hemoglobin
MKTAERASARAALAPGFSAGITEALIEAVVRAFYAEVRSDPLLAPVFNAAIQDWEPHLLRMCDFWSSVLLMSGRFKGTPMASHARLPELGPPHFARWLALFRDTVSRTCAEPAAALFISKAEMIAQACNSASRSAAVSSRPSQRGRSTPEDRDRACPNRLEAPAMLPDDARPYRRTPVFTQDTVPAALLRAHTTKEGTWALIRVLEGRLAYRVCDPRRPASEVVLTPLTKAGVIEPTIAHLVEPLGAVRFYVEFHQLSVVVPPASSAEPPPAERCST